MPHDKMSHDLRSRGAAYQTRAGIPSFQFDHREAAFSVTDPDFGSGALLGSLLGCLGKA